MLFVPVCIIRSSGKMQYMALPVSRKVFRKSGCRVANSLGPKGKNTLKFLCSSPIQQNFFGISTEDRESSNGRVPGPCVHVVGRGGFRGRGGDRLAAAQFNMDGVRANQPWDPSAGALTVTRSTFYVWRSHRAGTSVSRPPLCVSAGSVGA